MTTRPFVSRFVLLILFLLAFALRLYRLENQSLWWDEGISLHLATTSLAELIADRAANIHPPLYFIGLKAWVTLVGTTPFAARYFSLLGSWLQGAAVYALCRHWLSLKAGWIALFLFTFSPLSIIYAQEARVYAWLPLFYLALLLITWRIIQKPNPPTRYWFLLGLVAWLGFHAHYIAAFAIVYAGLWLLLSLYQQKRSVDLRRWFVTQFVVGLATLPWLALVWLNRSAVNIEANAGTYLTEPTPLPFLLAQVWVFHLTGLPGSLSRPVIQLLATIIAICLVLLILLRSSAPSLLRTLLPWFIPITAAFLAWSVRSFAHPRYVTIFAIMLIPIAAWAIGDWRLEARKRKLFVNLKSLVSILLFLSLLTISLLALRLYYFDPGVTKDDMRSVARYLEAQAGADDLILVPDTDWSLPFEYGGATAVAMPHTTNRADMWTHLQQLTQNKQRVFAVNYRRGGVDWQAVVPYALERVGSLVEEVKFGNLFVELYQLDEAVVVPQLAPAQARFGPLRLTAASIQTAAPADTALTLALRWQLDQPVTERLTVALRLLDTDNWQLAATDHVLVDEIGRPTEQWPITKPVTTYHVLPLPPGTPPLTYTLAASIYENGSDGPQPLDVLDEQGAPLSQQWHQAGIQLAPALGLPNPYRIVNRIEPLPQPLAVAEGLLLIGTESERSQAGAGQPLWVPLQWRAMQPLPDLRPALQLIQSDQILALNDDAPALGRYPTDQWRSGEVVTEHRRLLIPPTAVGPAQVVITLNNKQWVIGDIEISAESHLFAPPPMGHSLNVQFGDVARLIGYDLPQPSLSAAEPVRLTLYWQSLTTGSQVNYVVFTHILAEDGHLVGQHDSVPANGRRPLSTWLTDEYIIDPHELIFRETYTGTGRIEIGLYDPNTNVRLPTNTGDDFFYLPVTLDIK